MVSLLTLTACLQQGDDTSTSGTATTSEDLAESGDIIVSNFGNKSIVVLDSQGNYKNTLYNALPSAGLSPYGITYDPLTNEIYIGIDGTTADSILAVNIASGEQRTFYSGAQLSGNIRDTAIMLAGDILGAETSVIERFNSSGTSLGTFTPTMTNVNGLHPLTTGGLLACATGGSNNVKTFTSSYTLAYQVSLTGAYDCTELEDGTLAVTVSGAVDGVSIRTNATGLPLTVFYDNTAGTGEIPNTVMADPRGIAQRANGNILVTDYLYHLIVEMTSSGVYVGTLGGDVLNQPTFIIVVP